MRGLKAVWRASSALDNPSSRGDLLVDWEGKGQVSSGQDLLSRGVDLRKIPLLWFAV